MKRVFWSYLILFSAVGVVVHSFLQNHTAVLINVGLLIFSMGVDSILRAVEQPK